MTRGPGGSGRRPARTRRRAGPDCGLGLLHRRAARLRRWPARGVGSGRRPIQPRSEVHADLSLRVVHEDADMLNFSSRRRRPRCAVPYVIAAGLGVHCKPGREGEGRTDIRRYPPRFRGAPIVGSGRRREGLYGPRCSGLHASGRCRWWTMGSLLWGIAGGACAMLTPRRYAIPGSLKDRL